MKAITTKFLPFTNTLPSRIRASAEGVASIIYTVESLRQAGPDHLDPHQIAARQFAAHLGWNNTLVSGWAKDSSWAHCLLPETVTAALDLGRTLSDFSCTERFNGLTKACTVACQSLNI